MKANTKAQSGFGTIEMLLIILIIVILGFCGWFVWHSKNTTSTKAATASSTSQASATKKPASSDSTNVNSPTPAVPYVEVIQADESVTTVAPAAIAKTTDQQGVLGGIRAFCQKTPNEYVLVNYQVFTLSNLYKQDSGYTEINTGCAPKATTLDEVGGSASATYLHKQADGAWVVDGQSQMGAPACSDVDGKGYPATIIASCYDTDGTSRAVK